MYSVWFQDLEKVIQVMKEKVPTMETFSEIRGNAYGDFVIINGEDTYIVKHQDFTILHREGDWKNGKWVEV